MKTLVIAFLIFTSPLSFSQYKDKIPQSYASMGDSITAGAIASHSRRSSYFPDEGMLLILKLFQQIINGNNYGSKKLDDEYLSWSTGIGKRKKLSKRRVYGHRYFITKMLRPNTKLVSKNFSLSGSTAKNVMDIQLPRLLDWSQINLKQAAPDYTTLLVGINDLCVKKVRHITPVQEYYLNVKKIAETILSVSTTSKIFILSLPRVQNLRIQMSRSRVFGMMTCNRVWKTASICPVFNDPKSHAEFDIAEEHWEEYNLVLEQITKEMQDKYGDRIRLSKKISEIYFNKNDLAVDCFHPDAKGQQKIATESWKEGWWAE